LWQTSQTLNQCFAMNYMKVLKLWIYVDATLHYLKIENIHQIEKLKYIPNLCSVRFQYWLTKLLAKNEHQNRWWLLTTKTFMKEFSWSFLNYRVLKNDVIPSKLDDTFDRFSHFFKLFYENTSNKSISRFVC